jgi:hypothetical protein
MRGAYGATAAILLALSLACIATTVVKMAQGHWTTGSWQVWAAFVFHPVTALAALLLLCAARPAEAAKPAPETAAASPEPEEEQP